jgi:glycosyltransferase involved in cell wall biosynthesis
MKRIAYIISFVNKSVNYEWTVELLNKEKFNLTFILLNNTNSYFEDFLRRNNIDTYRINYSGKKNFLTAVITTVKILRNKKIEIVHAHLFDACIIGLLAAKFIGIKKRIHTRHNATIHHQYHPNAVKYDKLINYLSTDIIAISENVKNILIDMENADSKKISIIHHGIKKSDFQHISLERIAKLKEKYHQNESKRPVIGVISRYIHWKGIQYIIPAFIKILNDFPKAHLILANAAGPYEMEIKKQLSEIPAENYTEILFEDDIFALYKLFDIFVHTPIDKYSEAFGQIYIETMAAEIPSVVTMSGIAHEFIKNQYNALVVPYNNSEEIYNSIYSLLVNKDMQKKIIENGLVDVEKLFTVDKMINELEELYEK